MSNAFIPVYCEVKEKEGKERALDFARNFFWLMSLFLVIFATGFIYFADVLVAEIFARGFSGETLDLTILLTRIMFGYVVLISLAAVAQGVLNSEGIFWVSSFTPILLNLTIIGSAYGLSDLFANRAIPFALGVILGGFIQLAFQLPALKKQRLRLASGFNPKDRHIKEAMGLMIPSLFAAGIYQINILISNLIATTLDEGSLSSLTFSNRLMELVLGILVVSVTTVILPRLAGHFIRSELEEAARILKENLSLITLITLPVIAVTLVMAEEIVALLFLRGRFDEHSLFMTAGALRFHILGLVFIGVNRLFVSAFQAKKKIRIIVRISFVIMLVNLTGCWFLAMEMGHLGIALANSLSQAVQSLLLIFFLSSLGLSAFWNWSLISMLLRQLLLSGFIYFTLNWLKIWLQGYGLSLQLNFFCLLALLPVVVAIPLPLLARKEIKSLMALLRSRRA